MGWDYSETLQEHFMNPKNAMDMTDEEFGPSGIGEVGNIHCGDLMKMWIKLDDKEIIIDCRWKTYGCASAIGSTSMLSEMIKGLKLEEALKITPEDIMNELGGLPKEKIHCSVLGDKALRLAANDYFKKSGQNNRIKESKTMICECLSVSRTEIEELVSHGKATTYEKVQEITKVGTGCGKCETSVRNLIDELKKTYKID